MSLLIDGTGPTSLRTYTFPDANAGMVVGPAGFAQSIAGPTAARIYTFPDAACSVLTTNAAVTVAQGGTGLATLTAHALYVGNGISTPTALAVGATGTVLIGNTGADPSFSASPIVTSLKIGGSTASNVLLKNGSSSNFDIRLGDDSGYANVAAQLYAATLSFNGPGTVATGGDWRAQAGFTFKARNVGNTADGTILLTDAQDKAVLSGHFTSVANNGVISLGATTLGLLTVVTDGGATALFSVTGGSHTVLLISDPGPAFSVAAGTAGRANVYWSAGNSRYELENKLGSTLAFAATLIGKN